MLYKSNGKLLSLDLVEQNDTFEKYPLTKASSR